ncbi:DUF1684 domain-containing protein [Streptomyces sp. NPDC006430]|uniref:DUF1684 domain-containing protein n=1 Tax=Streptomyces sp. NPDC006430 TaxID=3154299 RepID=UPI0033B15CB5
MSDDADDPKSAWRKRHEHRVAVVPAPCGPLSLVGTLPRTSSAGTPRISDHSEERIPAVPGRRRPTEAGVVLTAFAEDGPSPDGEPFAGDAVLAAHEAPPAHSRLAAAGDVRILVIRREGERAVRAFDPAAEARLTFAGIEVVPYDPDFALPGLRGPYGEDRIVQVANADGGERELGPGSEPGFAHRGAGHTPRAAVDEDDDSLRAVIGDAIGGGSSYRFRFLKPGVPDVEEGAITLDPHWGLLPPAPSRTASSARSRRPGAPCPSRWRRAGGGRKMPLSPVSDAETLPTAPFRGLVRGTTKTCAPAVPPAAPHGLRRPHVRRAPDPSREDEK